MAKKTNSLLFRIGITSLWKNIQINFNKVFNNYRIEQLIYKELMNYKWMVLSVFWNNLNNVNIWIFTSFILKKKLKKAIIFYFKTIKNIRKVSEKYSLNYWFLKKIFKGKKLKKLFNENDIKVLDENIFYIFLLKWKLFLIIKSIFFYNKFSWMQLNLLIKFFLTIKLIKKSFFNFFLICWNSLKINFFKVNGLIYFKILSLFIENKIFILSKRHINIFCNSIWENNGLIFKSKVKYKNIFMQELLLLSCIYKNSRLFSEFIAFSIKKNKNHKKYLKQVINSIELFWKTRKVGIKGLQLRVAGKLNGKMRKSKYHYNIGKVQLQILMIYLDYNLCFSFTKFGIISVKFWIVYE